MKKLSKYISMICLIAVLITSLAGCAADKKKEASNNKAAVTATKAPSDDNTSSESKENAAVAEEEGTETVSSEEATTINILYSAGLCGIPLHIAKQLQFYEAEGLVEGVDYEYLTSSTPGPEMLTTGQADVTFGLVAAMLAPLDNGLEAKTVLGIHTGCIQVLAGSSTGITSVADLKGKKIGVEKLASSAHIVTQRALADAGIGSVADNMEVEFITYGKDELPIALQKGAVDAIAIGDPQATILINDGYAVPIFNSATSDLLKDEYCCSLWIRNETLEKYPDQVAKVVNAIQKASAWVDQNVDIAARIQLDNEWLVGDLEIDRQILKTYKYLPSVSGVEEALTRNILDMKDLGLIREDTNADDLAKNSFLRLEGVPDEITGIVEAPIDPLTQTK